MGDDSPDRGLQVASFAKLLCQVKNIEKGENEDPPQESDQPYIHISSDSKRDPKSDTLRDPKSDHRRDPKKDPKRDPKRDFKRFNVRPVTWSGSPSPDKRSRKRDISPTSEGSGGKRAFAARQESHNESEAHPEKSKEYSPGSDKSPKQSNSPPGFIFTSHSRRANLVSIAVHEDEVNEARRADQEKSDSHQRLSKERDGNGDSQTSVTDPSLRSSRSQSPCGSRVKGEGGSRKRKNDHQRSRAQSPQEKRERNLAPKEWQDERARLISSKDFLEEARKLMEAPLASAQQPVPALPLPVSASLRPSVDSQCPSVVERPPLEDDTSNYPMASAQKSSLKPLKPSVESQCQLVVERSSMDKKDSFNYPYNTVQEFESKVLKDSHPKRVLEWVNQTARIKSWLVHECLVQCLEGGSGPPNNRMWKHAITVKEVTVEATARKKIDAKILAFKLMAIKLGEILQLIKPQPDTLQSQLDEQVRLMMYEGRTVLSGTSNSPLNSTLSLPIDSTPPISLSPSPPSDREHCNGAFQQATEFDSTLSISPSPSSPSYRKHSTGAVQQAKELEKILDIIIVSGKENADGGSKSINLDMGCPDERSTSNTSKAPTEVRKRSIDRNEGSEKENTKKDINTPRSKKEETTQDLSKLRSGCVKGIVTIREDNKDELVTLKDWKSSHMVFVSGLRSSSTEQVLMKAFSRCGRVAKIFITRKPPGYAYILFEHTADASNAVRKLHETQIGEHRMRVEVPKERGTSMKRNNNQEERRIEPRIEDINDTNKTGLKDRGRESPPAGDLRSKLQGIREYTHKEAQNEPELPEDRRKVRGGSIQNLVIRVQDSEDLADSSCRSVMELPQVHVNETEDLVFMTTDDLRLRIGASNINHEEERRVIKIRDNPVEYDSAPNKRQKMEETKKSKDSGESESQENLNLANEHNNDFEDHIDIETSVLEHSEEQQSELRHIIITDYIPVDDLEVSNSSVQSVKDLPEVPSTIVELNNKDQENVDVNILKEESKTVSFGKKEEKVNPKFEVKSDPKDVKLHPKDEKDVKLCPTEEKYVKLVESGEYFEHDTNKNTKERAPAHKEPKEEDMNETKFGEYLEHDTNNDTKEEAQALVDTDARPEPEPLNDTDASEPLKSTRKKFKEAMTGHDFIQPEIARFADFYLDYMESEKEIPSPAEGDELMIQVCLLGCDDLEELLSIIGEHIVGCPTNEMWKNRFSEIFISIKAGIVPDLELIIKILIFQYQRSAESSSSDNNNQTENPKDPDVQLHEETETCDEDIDLNTGTIASSTNTNHQDPDHQQEDEEDNPEEIDLFDSTMNAVAEIFTTPNGIKLVKKSSSPSSEKEDESRSAMIKLNTPLESEAGGGAESIRESRQEDLPAPNSKEASNDAAKGCDFMSEDLPTLTKHNKEVQVVGPLLKEKSDDCEKTINSEPPNEAGPSQRLSDIPLTGNHAGNSCLSSSPEKTECPSSDCLTTAPSPTTSTSSQSEVRAENMEGNLESPTMPTEGERERRSIIGDPYGGTDFCQCPLCDFLTPSARILHTHSLKLHETECKYCNKQFVNMFDLKVHQAKCHDKWDVRHRQCPFCKEVILKKKFSKHAQKHNLIKSYRCDPCQLNFLTKGHLWQHNIVAHRKREQQIKQEAMCQEKLSNEQKKETEKNSELTCTICKATFKTAGLLRRHKRLGCKKEDKSISVIAPAVERKVVDENATYSGKEPASTSMSSSLPTNGAPLHSAPDSQPAPVPPPCLVECPLCDSYPPYLLHPVLIGRHMADLHGSEDIGVECPICESECVAVGVYTHIRNKHSSVTLPSPPDPNPSPRHSSS